MCAIIPLLHDTASYLHYSLLTCDHLLPNKGTAPEPRPHLIGGHMPGALSLPFTSLVQADDVTTFKSASEIRDALKDAGTTYPFNIPSPLNTSVHDIL